MKRVALALALLVVGGILGAALVSMVPLRPRFPSALGVAPSEATNLSSATTSRAPVTAEPAPVTVQPEPAPARLAPEPKPPSPEIASVPDSRPPPVVKTPPAQPVQAKPAIERGTEREVRDLSKGRCDGRTIKSITVLPDDSVHVEC